MNYESPEERKLGGERQKTRSGRHQNNVQRLLVQDAKCRRYEEEAAARRQRVAEQVRQSKAKQKAKETEEQAAARRQRVAEQVRQSRAKRKAQETEEQAAARRQRAAEQVRKRRSRLLALETEEQAKERRRRENDKLRQWRAKRKVHEFEAARDQQASSHAANRKSTTPSDFKHSCFLQNYHTNLLMHFKP